MLEEDNSAPVEKESAKAKIGYWCKWIKASKKAADRHFQDSKAAYDEYEYERTAQTKNSDAPAPCYPAYFSRVELLRPAYYSKTPKLTARRKFDIADAPMMLGAQMAERIGEYLLESGNFDTTMYSIVDDFIHADKATGQVIYEADKNPKKERRELSQEGEQYLENGQVYEGEVYQDDSGLYYEAESFDLSNKRIYAKACSFDEVLHTPEAKSPEEIKEMAYFFSIPKEEAEERFGDKLENYQWKVGKSYQEHDKKPQEGEEIGKFLEGWECYCLESKKIYWVCEEIPEFLDVQDDSLGLQKFFPSPYFIIGSKPRKSLYPTPIYTRLRSTLNQLHSQYSQTFGLISSIRRRALIDGTIPELRSAFEDLNSEEFITVKNLQELVEKKGLQNLIWYLPVQELVAAIGELAQIEDRLKNLVDEWFGTPEIMRGVSDPTETAAAQEIKTGAAHDRFKFKKKQVAGIARDLIELMFDAALKVYEDQEIMQIVGFQFMTPEEQQMFPEALAILRNDTQRLIRLDIETDSTSFVDERQQQAQVNAVVQTLISGLKEISSMFQTAPEFAPIAMQALLKTLSSLPGGKEFEDDVRQQVYQVMLAKQQPQGEPPPDPKLQIAQIQSQTSQANKQIEAQVSMQKMGLESQKISQDFQLKITELNQDIEKSRVEISQRQQEIELKREELMLLAQTAGNDAVIRQAELELNDRIASTDALLEKMAQDLDSKYQMMEEREKLMTEDRLQFEAQLKAISPQITQPQSPQLPPISINVDAKPQPSTADILNGFGRIVGGQRF